MSKFKYTHFGDEVPREVEKEYNRMGRREHYLEEQDAAHDVMYLDHKDISRIPDYPADELSPADLLREARLCYLSVAMELMRMDYPFEYQLIRDYYLSEKAISMMYLAKKYMVIPLTHQYLIAVIQRSWQGATKPPTLYPYVGEGLGGTPIYHICPVCLQKCGVSGG